MKIYSLENIKTPLDLVCMTENIKTDISCVIVLDTFTDIADKIQKISISLFHIEIEDALREVQSLSDDCMDWLNRMIVSEGRREEAEQDIKIHIRQMADLCNEAPRLVDDRDIMAQGAIISSLFLSHLLRMQGKEN